MAVLDCHCCSWAFSSCGEWGYTPVAVCGLLIGWLLLLGSTGPWVPRLSSCAAQA